MPKSMAKSRAGPTKPPVETKKPDPDLNEEIDSDSDLESRETDSDVNDRLVDEEDEETVQDRKIRLAKRLIEKIQQQKEDDLNEREQHDFVSKKLEEDLQAKTGKLRKEVAERYIGGEILKRFRGHRLTVTCLVVSPDSKIVFSGSKDGSIVKWNFETGVKLNTIRKRTEGVQETSTGHRGEILCLALTQDFKFLASSGRDRSIRIWKPDTCEFVYNFEGHRDAVSGLAFRLNSHDLYSCSFDRSVKVWNVDQLAYAETLFGHQDSILGIDSLNRERCVTCGGRDRTVRIWKIVEESQLVFNGTHFDSIDCICLLNEEFFFSGSNDSTLAVWNINKKKPILSVKNAHGPSVSTTNGHHHDDNSEKTNGSAPGQFLFNQSKPTYWISAVAAYHNSDLLASGSDDGYIKLWSFTANTNSLKEIFKIQINGFINDLKFSQDGQYLIAAVGQEHKLGRWSSHKNAKNEVVVVKLNTTNTITTNEPKLQNNTNKKLKV